MKTPLSFLLLLWSCWCVVACSSEKAVSEAPATLSSLSFDAGTLAPAFTSDVAHYALTLPNATTKLSVTATAASASGASISIAQGDQAAPSVAGATLSSALTVPAAGAQSLVKVTVRGSGRSEGVYEVVLTRAAAVAAANDATLSSLEPSLGALVPVFSSAHLNYTLRVPHGSTRVALTPTASDPAATIQIAGARVPSGQKSAEIELPGGATPFPIDVALTAADGTTTGSYKIQVLEQELADAATIYGVGDSTMANYEIATYPNRRGWGQLFPEFLKGLSFSNAAINGQSSKSFYRTGPWDVVKNKLKAGDYVFIQFGHNDEKDAGIEGTSNIGTEAWGSYHATLENYVTEARALGAVPVLFTPIVRCQWDGDVISASGRHDLTGNGTAQGDANYPAAMRDVAKQLDCPLVDLTELTASLAQEYGRADAKSILYLSTDDTHLQVMGAAVYAQLAVKGLLEQGILRDSLEPNLGIVVTPPAELAARFVGSHLDSGFSVMALPATTSATSLLLAVDGDFSIGSDRTQLGDSLELPLRHGALAPTTVALRFEPTSAGARVGQVNLTLGADAFALPLSAQGLVAPAAATEFEAAYALDSVDSGVACNTAGFVECVSESFLGLLVKDYVPLTTVLPMPQQLPVQRLMAVGDSWTAETAETATRYVEFAVSPAAGKSLDVDSLSLYAGVAGGPILSFVVQSSTQPDFSDPTTWLSPSMNVTNTVELRTFGPLPTLADGQTLRVRVYPYAKSAVSKQYLALQSLLIHGVAH